MKRTTRRLRNNNAVKHAGSSSARRKKTTATARRQPATRAAAILRKWIRSQKRGKSGTRRSKSRGGSGRGLTPEEMEHNERLRFTDPISHMLFRRPVVVGNDEMYENELIREWLRTHNTSPMTLTRVTVDMLRDASPEFMEELERYAAAHPELERYEEEEGLVRAAVLRQPPLPFGAVPTNRRINQLLEGAGPRNGHFSLIHLEEYGPFPAGRTFTSIRFMMFSLPPVAYQTLSFPAPVSVADAVTAVEEYMRTPMTREYFEAFRRNFVMTLPIEFEDFRDSRLEDGMVGSKLNGAFITNLTVDGTEIHMDLYM